MVRFSLAAATALALHGCGAQVFICADVSDCPGGTCEASGFCSFPDDACPSGQRYGGHAPASVANECVDPVAGTSGEGDGTTTSSSTAVTTLDSTDPVSEASSSPLTTTSSVDESSSTAIASSSESGSLPPDVPPDLPPCVVETFDDEVFDEFAWWTDGPQPTVVDGTLSIALTTMPAAAGLDFPSGGFVEREAKVTVLAVPNQTEATQVALAVGIDGTAMLILHEDGLLIVRYDDGMTIDNRVTVMPVVPATWRIRSHDDTLIFERDVGNGWEMLWSEAPDFDLATAGAFFYVNTWQATMMPGTAQLDDLSDCPYGGG